MGPIAVAWIWLAGPAVGQAVAPQAAQVKQPFTPVAMPVAPETPLQDGATPIAIDFAALGKVAAGEIVVLPVEAGREITGSVTRIERRTAGRYSIFGRIEDDPESYFIIAVENGVAAGVIEAPARGELHRLGHLAEGVGQIMPIYRTDYPECGLPATPAGGTPAPRSAPPAEGDPDHGGHDHDGDGDGDGGDGDGGPDPRGGCSAPARNFDVIIAYTTAARIEAGGTTAIQATAQLAVDTANQVYDDSQINPRVTLVFTKEVGYVESTNMADDRDRLTDPNDGFMDTLHDDRDDLGADFVTLFVANVDTTACGIAHCTPSGADQGFCIVQQGCSVSNFSFAHEIGHLQGCAHDFGNAGIGCNEFCYSYGWRFFGDSGVGWRTVMAYDNNNNDFTRIGRFSNPSVFWDGEPTGNDNQPCIINENNTRTINDTAADREAWRSPKLEVWAEDNVAIPWVGTFHDPFPSVLLGVAAIFDGSQTPLVQPTLRVKAGSYNETLTISKPVTIRSCGGSAIIGR